MTRSLTARVLLGALIWIVLAIGIGGYGVYRVFEASAVRQFDFRLNEEMELLIAAIAFQPDSPAARMTTPAFQRIYSGTYWQALQTDTVFQSRSLQGFTLPVPNSDPMTWGETSGPDGQPLRFVSSTVTTPDGLRWDLTVAANVAQLRDEQDKIQVSLWLGAGLLTFALSSAAFLLLRAALAPLSSLREAVQSLSDDKAAHDPSGFPSEISPLVADLNDAFEKNIRQRQRGEIQAANLAHALKTPAAILQNEISRVSKGEQLDTIVASAAVAQISTTAEAHLRASMATRDDTIAHPPIDAAHSLRNLVSATARLFPDLRFAVVAPEMLELKMPENAFQEILGNLVENAGKWAKHHVRITLESHEQGAKLRVEDDGPGIAPEHREKVLRQHVRLDQTKPGAGLGLSIVVDIVDRMDGTTTLGASDLGGLCAEIRLI